MLVTPPSMHTRPWQYVRRKGYEISGFDVSEQAFKPRGKSQALPPVRRFFHVTHMQMIMHETAHHSLELCGYNFIWQYGIYERSTELRLSPGAQAKKHRYFTTPRQTYHAQWRGSYARSSRHPQRCSYEGHGNLAKDHRFSGETSNSSYGGLLTLVLFTQEL